VYVIARLYEDTAKRPHAHIEFMSFSEAAPDGAAAQQAWRHAPEDRFAFEFEGRAVPVEARYIVGVFIDDDVAEDVTLAALSVTPRTTSDPEYAWLGLVFGIPGIKGYFTRRPDASAEPTDADLGALRLALDEVMRRLPLRRVSFLLHLDSLSLTDFRGFESATIPFGGPLTVLLGNNGAGKSTVLDGIAVALSPYVRAFVPASLKLRPLHELDVRVGADRAAVEAKFHAFAAATQNASRVEKTTLGTSAPVPVFEPPAAWTALSRQGRPGPLDVHYPTNRAVLDIPVRIRDKHVFVPHAALDGALSGANTATFRHFFEWFREREDLENESAARHGENRHDVQLAAVRRAVVSALPGFSNLRVRRSPLRMTVQKGTLELRVDQLSDGEKCFLALIGDLARRLAIANPWHEDALKASAIVLIDEIELHMHPEWQRTVTGILRGTFPNCQFIVTTHSPQVLAEVPNESIVRLDGFMSYSKHAGTFQRDSNAILSEVMGVSERPKAMADQLQAVNRLLDDEKVAEARAEIDRIAAVLGRDDHEVVGLRTALALIEPAAS
jgi:predicted ATP-binding protein involved in virulence